MSSFGPEHQIQAPGTPPSVPSNGDADAPPAPAASDIVDTLAARANETWQAVRSIDPLWLLQNALISLLLIAAVLGLRFVLGRALNRLRRRFGDTEDDGGPWRAMRRVFDIALFLALLTALLATWGVDLGSILATDLGAQLAKAVVGILLVLFLSVVAWNLTDLLIQRTIGQRVSAEDRRRQSARLKTLIPVLRGVARTVIMTFAALLILSELGVNLGPLLAGAGIVGVAVGFGAQSLVKDFLVGVMLLLEDAASIGDVVQVGDHAGLVEHMGVRVMRLRDLEGIVHIIPYSEVSIIKNFTKDFAFALLNVGVAYREDTDEVVEVLREVAGEMRADETYGAKILDDLEVLGVDAFADSAVVIKIRLKTLPIEQWSVAREYRRRIKQRFDQQGIEIPFPHQTLYFGVDKSGEAPPARVRLQEPGEQNGDDAAE